MRHIWDRRPGRQPRILKLALELTTNPAMPFDSARIAGKMSRSGGPFHLQLAWSDAAALAKGSSELYVVARDTRRAAVDQIAVDREMVARAEPHLLTAFTDIEHMIADPQKLCVRSDDLGTDDIIVT